MRSRRTEWILLVSGIFLVGGFASHLRGNGGLRHSQNPLAIQRSGYGMILARLSQNTVNRVWHYGLEGPAGHHHKPGDDDCELCAPPHHQGQGGGNPDSAPDGNSGGNSLPPDHLVSVAGLPVTPATAKETGIVESALSQLLDLKKAGYARTNPEGLSQAHRRKVASDIEKVLLRSYQMDPTDYGVYNAYYLFLTIHDLCATPAAERQAKKVAGLTIGAAMGETESPFPWLTAASALLDQFLSDQQIARETGKPLSRTAVQDYSAKMAHCLAQFKAVREKAIAERRWQSIGAERTEGADERLRFLERTSEQFAAILARTNQHGLQAATEADNPSF